MITLLRPLAPAPVTLIEFRGQTRVALAPTVGAVVTNIGRRGAVGPVGQAGAPGPTGPPGPAGAALIGGYPTSMTGLSPGDHLEFATDTWINVVRTTITDGGNF